jgi:hypothetical protein
MRDLFFLASLVVGMCTSVFALAIWLADNETVSRRFATLSFSVLLASAYDWFFVAPVHSFAVESAVGVAEIGLVFAITATAGDLILRRKR